MVASKKHCQEQLDSNGHGHSLLSFMKLASTKVKNGFRKTKQLQEEHQPPAIPAKTVQSSREEPRKSAHAKTVQPSPGKHDAAIGLQARSVQQ